MYILGVIPKGWNLLVSFVKNYYKGGIYVSKLSKRFLGGFIAFIMLITSVLSGTVLSFADDGFDDRGDFNGNGTLEVDDASAILTYVLGKKDYKGSLAPKLLIIWET